MVTECLQLALHCHVSVNETTSVTLTVHKTDVYQLLNMARFSLTATKQEKLLQKRYAEFLKYPAVTKTIILPHVLPSVHGQYKSEMSFSVSDGMKWKVSK